MAPKPVLAYCEEKQRLIAAYLEAVTAYHDLQNEQIAALVHGEGFENEEGIFRAADRREQAKYAILAHRQDHGC